MVLINPIETYVQPDLVFWQAINSISNNPSDLVPFNRIKDSLINKLFVKFNTLVKDGLIRIEYFPPLSNQYYWDELAESNQNFFSVEEYNKFLDVVRDEDGFIIDLYRLDLLPQTEVLIPLEIQQLVQQFGFQYNSFIDNRYNQRVMTVFGDFHSEDYSVIECDLVEFVYRLLWEMIPEVYREFDSQHYDDMAVIFLGKFIKQHCPELYNIDYYQNTANSFLNSGLIDDDFIIPGLII